VDLVSLAKSKPLPGSDGDLGERSPERIFLPGVKNAVVLRQNSSELFLLERLRDEAHRFANVLHDKLRRRGLRSKLQEVPGIGTVRQRALLRHFGSLKRVREASLEALAAAPGMNARAARAVHEFLHGGVDAEEPSDTGGASADGSA
jgi:excinuclease ABC subunit C